MYEWLQPASSPSLLRKRPTKRFDGSMSGSVRNELVNGVRESDLIHETWYVDTNRDCDRDRDEI